MKLPNNNYIKKANDLYFCLNRFIDHNISKNNKIYIFHLDSKTKDYELLRNKILKNWKLAFGRRYECSAVGAIEHDSNGYWHCHLLVCFERSYRANTMANIASQGRKLWIKNNQMYSGIKLNSKRFEWEELDISRRDRLTAVSYTHLRAHET